MNKEEITNYYNILEQNNTELRAIAYYKDGEALKTKVVEVREVSNIDNFLDFCQKWDGKANVYAGIHERLPGGTKTKDVCSVKIIAVDIDSNHPVNQAATKEELDKCKEETFKMLEELSNEYGRPTMIMTGNGYQLLWKIRPINISDKNRELIESKIKKWIECIQQKYNSESKKIDQIGDLARILKVAGTTSVKGENTEERPFRQASFIELNQQTSDSLRDEILTTKIEFQKEEGRKIISPKTGYFGKFDYLLTKDSKLAALYNGNSTGYESRSEAEQALVCKLVYYEFSDGEIDLIMGTSGLGKWNTAHKNYRELTITKARLLIREKKDDFKDIKIEDVYTTITKWLYFKDFLSIDLMLAIILSQRLEKSNPIWMIFVGASGDGKSELARAIEHLSFIYKVDQLTPNTLVSGHTKVEDLAPQLNNKVLLITDFASILSLNSDAQRLIFAQLRNLYDGEAFKDSGAGARKHYTGLRVTLIANSTPVISHRVLIHQDLGTRELLYRTDEGEKGEDYDKKSLRALENEGKKDEIKKEIQLIVSAFLDNIKDINQEISEEMKLWLLQKAKWLSIMRAVAPTDGYSGELLANVVPEVPTRLLMQLKLIYLCLKSLSPNYPEERAKEIILRIIHSSAKESRVKIYEYIYSSDSEVTSTDIAETLKLSKKTIFTECAILWNMELIKCRKSKAIAFGRETEINYWHRPGKVRRHDISTD